MGKSWLKGTGASLGVIAKRFCDVYTFMYAAHLKVGENTDHKKRVKIQTRKKIASKCN